jgi:hypothetical protein
MRRGALTVVLGAFGLVLLAAGCGSGKSTTTSRSPKPVITQTSAPPASATTTSIPSSNGAPSAVLPAQFTVNADGSLSPRLVAGPLDTTILLTVASRASHPVTLSVAARSLTVSPGGHASARLQGLKAGRYTIQVDGTPRAALVVGAQPGP